MRSLTPIKAQQTRSIIMSNARSLFVKSDSEVVDPSNGFKKDITFLGKDPLICKLIADPRQGSGAVVVSYFEYSIGGYKYKTPSLSSIGRGDDPRLERYREIRGKISELTKSGVKQDDERIIKLKAIADKFYPKDGIFLYFVEPNDPTIKCLKTSIMVKHQIYGRQGTKTSKEIPSLKDEMAKRGSNLFLNADPEKNKKGWLKIWRTGEKMGTEYHVVEASEQIAINHEGSTVYVTKPTIYNVHEDVYKDFDLDKLPDPFKYELTWAWTKEEAAEYVSSGGTKIPERVIKLVSKKNESDEDTTTEGDIDASSVVPPPSASLMGEIPF